MIDLRFGSLASAARLLVSTTLLAALTACGGSSNGDDDDDTGASGAGTGGSSGSAGSNAGTSSAGKGGAAGTSSAGGRGGSSGSSGASSGSSGAAGTNGGSDSSGSGGTDAGTTGDGGTTSDAGTGGEAGTAGTGGAGGDGGDGSCSLECSEGVCFLGLDGTPMCATPRDDLELEDCEFTTEPCCTMDAECTDGDGGRCVSNISQYFGCGGAVPVGNSCYYDACAEDSDCTPGSGATVTVCVPPGAFGFATARCIDGGCRTDADCTTAPDGRCYLGEARTHGTCDRRLVFYCAYPSDPCQNQNDGCSSPQICLPNDDGFDGRSCGPAAPMYP